MTIQVTNNTAPNNYGVNQNEGVGASSNNTEATAASVLNIIKSLITPLKDLLQLVGNFIATHDKNLSVDANSMKNKVNQAIKNATEQGDPQALPDDVIAFMKKNNIKVENMSIDDFLKKNGPKLDKEKLNEVQSALGSYSSSESKKGDQIKHGFSVAEKALEGLGSMLNKILNTLHTA